MLLSINPAPQLLDAVGELNAPAPTPDRERLRHLIIGSPEGVQLAIARLHVLQYAEQLAWSQQFTIPPTGIRLTPAQGEVFSYLLRYRAIG